MRITQAAILLLLAGTLAAAQTPANSTTKIPEPTKVQSFDLTAMDKNVDPCTNFYEYACGSWRRNNPIPGDQSRWGRFNELFENNQRILANILQAAADNKNATGAEKQLGDFYAACMNESAVNSAGLKPIQQELKRINGIKNREQLMQVVADLHEIGVPVLMGFGPQSDFRDANKIILNLSQGGFTLPDRDLYLKDDDRSKDIRTKYLEHVQKIFELTGEKPDQAAADAKTVMAVETELAEGATDRTMRRDPKRRDNKTTRAQLVSAYANLEFQDFLKATTLPSVEEMNVSDPGFFKNLNDALNTLPLDQWKTYLRWRLVKSYAPYLSSDFVNENFRFSGQVLSGQKELAPRWKRCVSYTDDQLGEALGELYVEKTFGAEGKKRMNEMIGDLRTALQADIKQLPWMTETTKQKAFEKLNALRSIKVGYPDKYRDYSSIKIARNDLVGNIERSNQFEEARQLRKVGKPLDRTEWGMTPPTVNAYYSSNLNEIVFPAGILQPPFFDLKADDAVNYGGIGVVIGHEFTHGFDDQGRKFAADGSLTDWWTPEDAKAFEERAGCVADQYSTYAPVAGANVNGKLTLGENTADNGGLRIAYAALMENLEREGRKQVVEGFTPEQRFFIGYGQIWCQNTTEQYSRRQVQEDPHSPGQFRVNGAVSNFEEFGKAFNCKPGAQMVRTDACRVW